MKRKIKKQLLGFILVWVVFILSATSAPFAFAGAFPGGPALSEPGLFEAEQYRGKVVYLDFWASWCTPCKESFPWMQQLHEKYESMGLKVVTVNLDKKRASADKFLKKYPADFTVLFDPSGALADKYQLAGMPMSYIIDRKGIVRYRHIGYIPAMQALYEQQIVDLLKK